MYEKHKSTEKLEDICSLKHDILHFVMGEVGTGFSDNPQEVHILGEYVDMIKDLAEAEKECYEACYYESVVAAMDAYGDNPRMGYNPSWRPMGRDRYPEMDHEGRSSRTDRGMRMDDSHMDDPDWDDRYDRSFNQFRKAKRHYTRTHSEEDKMRMKEHANEHMMSAMSTIREIYDSADPELKKRMKTDLTKLTGEMTV